MALHTSTQIRIEGHKRVADTFQLLTLHESIGDHHRFKLELSGRAFGRGRGTASWRELVGRRIYIEIAPTDENLPLGSKVFSGLITGLSLAKDYGSQGRVILEGGSPTLLLDDDPHMATFSQQSLQRIIRQQLSAYPTNLLRPQVNPATDGPLEYVVQYKETSWQLLQRLASEHGEWLFYNGQQLIFGRCDPDTVSLIHDRELDRFALQLDVRANNMQMTGYDYTGDQSAASDSASHQPSGINVHSRTALEASQSLYTRRGQYKPNHALQGDAGGRIDQIASRRSASTLGGMVRLNGTSHHPGLGVGAHLSLEERFYGKEAYGEFMLTGVHHRCDSEGHYSNRFRGIPADVAAPSFHLEAHPRAEAQSAVVVDNHDPDDLGRVRVRFRWQQSGMTPWLRMLSPAGGDGKGFHMIPEKGEEVWVDFEGGHPELPYVVGAARNGRSPSGDGTPENDIKSIRTRSGHTIELKDAEGGESITIKDKNGNAIRMNTGKKSITITAPEDMTLNAKNMEMNIRENLRVNVGKSKTERIREDRNLEAKNSITKILENRTVRSGEKTEQQAGELTVHTSTGEMLLDGAGKVTIQSKDRIDFGE
ncbi:Uncharacterized conserved protein, implicated in type VI secretion and phage assembly [Fodinibius roseus]|uniref:Uncharacterized conserved protein, implicated in type VI secretion and phage assembly n=1 Tax=Fodinibius roseus TaxID=1194090 RepID=A0A1M5KXC4_9BACT|nr:type VI secretion system Vgr family protein [Fodinibius roseus]SHG57448.1 Uncharacterized conserved protein, implicated in type VI secretion and phage assembly [Fodinibius roseus]